MSSNQERAKFGLWTATALATIATMSLVAGAVVSGERPTSSNDELVNPLDRALGLDVASEAFRSNAAKVSRELAALMSRADSTEGDRSMTLTASEQRRVENWERASTRVELALDEFWSTVAEDPRFDSLRTEWASCAGAASETELAVAVHELYSAGESDAAAELAAAGDDCTAKLAGEFNELAEPLVEQWIAKNRELVEDYRRATLD
jgi:hypothetical protein